MKTNQWIKPFLFTLLVVVVPIATYYVYSVEAREKSLLERFHAHLANIATRTDARFSSAFDVITYNQGRKNDLGVKTCKSPTDETPSLKFVSRTAPGELTFHAPVCETTADIATLVGDLDAERQFYDLAIFDEHDKVVFQRDPKNGRIADGQLSTPAVAESAESKTGIKDPLVEMRRSYQGQTFLVFAQPLNVPIKAPDRDKAGSSDQGRSWKIVGLLEQAEFTRLKYSVGPSGLAVVVLLVLFVLVAAPFLKLRYLGRFERLSRYDIALQAGAGLSLIAIATVAWLAWNTHVRLSQYVDGRLESIAQHLAGAIEQEFRGAATTLSGLEPLMQDSYRNRSTPDRPSRNKGGCVFAQTASASDGAERRIATASGDILGKLKDETRDYRQLSLAYLMDRKGCQIVKWASAATVPDPGQFDDRSYFRRALPDERNRLELNLDIDATTMVVQDIVISRTTGDREIVFSKPVAPSSDCATEIRDNRDDRARVACVSVITGRLRALESVLPRGFGAMLLSANADIQWRSDGDTSTELNLAKEIDEPDRLHTLVRIATETHQPKGGESFDADYQRKPHRFHVMPLEFGDLALVVFYSRNLVTATVLESVGAASIAWLIWVSVLVALFLALWIADDMLERSLRHWPRCLGVALPGVVAAAWFSLKVSPALSFAAIGIALSIIPLLLLAGQDSARISAQRRRFLVVLPMWFAVTLAAAVPMKVLYDQAELATLNGLARFEAREYAHDLVLQGKVFEQWQKTVALPAKTDWSDVPSWWRNEEFLDRSGAAAGDADHVPCTLFAVVCHILEKLPDYSADLSVVHAFYREAPPPTEDVRDRLLGRAPKTYRFHYVVALLAAALSFVAVWYLLVRAFGLRAENIVDVSSAPVPNASEEAHHIVYGVPTRDRHAYFDRIQAAQKLWLDLRDASPGTKIDISHSTDAIAIDEFDSGLNDISVVQQRVELLERLLRERRRVILLFVSTDLLNFVVAQYDTEQAVALLSRFATALSRFKYTYHGTDVERQPQSEGTFVTDVLAAIQRLRAASARLGWRKQLVESECRHPDLWEIRDDLLKDAETRKWSKGQIIQQVQGRANATFQHMWSKCTRVEKFTLIELAMGHPVNPNNWDAARRLRMRGYVLAAPFYRIASESLRQFVGRMARLEDVQRWRDENPGAWSQVKVPLLILFLSVIAFLAVTQPALFNSVIAFAAAGLATFPFLASALSARFQRAASSGGK